VEVNQEPLSPNPYRRNRYCRVNAKNESGGYTGFRRFVSGGQSVIVEERDNIADAWSGTCL